MLTAEQIKECCDNEDCCNYVKCNLPKEHCDKVKEVGASGDWLNLVFQVLPVILDLIQKWRNQNNPTPAPETQGKK